MLEDWILQGLELITCFDWTIQGPLGSTCRLKESKILVWKSMLQSLLILCPSSDDRPIVLHASKHQSERAILSHLAECGSIPRAPYLWVADALVSNVVDCSSNKLQSMAPLLYTLSPSPFCYPQGLFHTCILPLEFSNHLCIWISWECF